MSCDGYLLLGTYRAGLNDLGHDGILSLTHQPFPSLPSVLVSIPADMTTHKHAVNAEVGDSTVTRVTGLVWLPEIVTCYHCAHEWKH